MEHSNERAASPPASVRAKHELETIALLKGQPSFSRSVRLPPPSARTRTGDDHFNLGGVLPLSDGDIDLALQGLDRAEIMCKTSEDRKRALRLYEISLDVLVRALQSRSSFNGYDNDVLAERARVAMTEAESLKEKIKADLEADTGLSISKSETAEGDSLLSSAVSYLLPRRSNSSRTIREETGHAEEFGMVGAGRTVRNRTGSSGVYRTAASAPRSYARPTASSTNRTSRGTGGAAARTSVPSRSNAATNSVGGAAFRMHRDNDASLRQIVLTELWTNNPEKNGSASASLTWSDVAGLENAKQNLQEAVILPLLRPDLYTGMRSAPKGILLYGPPGTGKTMLARAAAHESQCNFFVCSASSLTSKWVGEGEKILRALFQCARSLSPSVVFFDEIDALLSARKSDEHEASRRFKTEFMVQVDGALNRSDGDNEHVLVLGCTNCPWDIDDAVMRRFQRRIYVPLPDYDARKALISKMLQKNRHSLSKRQVDKLIRLTEGYSCSDISAIGSEAAFGPLRSLGGIAEIRSVRRGDVRPISFDDFSQALANNGKSVSAALLRRYDEWERDQS